MRMTAEQFQNASMRGNLRQQLIRTVQNPEVHKTFGKSRYRPIARTEATCMIDPRSIGESDLVYAGRNSEGLVLLQTLQLHTQRPLVSAALVSAYAAAPGLFARFPQQLSAVVMRSATVGVTTYLGVQLEDRWRMLDVALDRTLDVFCDTPALPVAAYFGDVGARGGRSLTVEVPTCAQSLQLPVRPEHAYLDTSVFTAMDPTIALELMRGAEYFVRWPAPLLRRRLHAWKEGGFFPLGLGAYGVSVIEGLKLLGVDPVEHAVPLSLAPLGAIAIFSAIYTARRRAHIRQAQALHGELWAMLHTTARLRAEPDIIAAALDAFAGTQERTVVLALEQMAVAGYLEVRERQFLADTGEVYDVRHYDLIRRPPPGNKPDKRRLLGLGMKPEIAFGGV